MKWADDYHIIHVLGNIASRVYTGYGVEHAELIRYNQFKCIQ